MRSALSAMMQQRAIAASDQGASVSKQRFYGMAGRGFLPFMAIERVGMKHDLRDLLLRCAFAMAVEALQHPA